MKLCSLALTLSAALAAQTHADGTVSRGMAFTPIAGSAYGQETAADVSTRPWIIPYGFTQSIVSDETRLNLYVGHDRYDMNTVNESGMAAGRYLYRTHEVRGGAIGSALRIDGGSGAAVSVVDLKTGVAREVVWRADWEGLDGLVWTPWHTLMFAEEVDTAARTDPDVPEAQAGLVYELTPDPKDPMSAERVIVRPLLGAMAHEGIEVDAAGHVYVVDEYRKGAIYRFVPARFGDLSSGQLYALRVKNGGKTGPAEWVALDVAQARIRARIAAEAVQATGYCRPEDIERIDHTLYVALTCEDVDDPDNTSGVNANGHAVGAVLAVDLGEQPVVRYAVAAGKNTPFEVQPTADKSGVTGFAKVDNLASGPDGRLWMVEDNEYSDIWVYDPRSSDLNGDGFRDDVQLFASLKDRQGEGSGVYFGTDANTLYVNVQHAGTGNDKTMAISKAHE